MLRVEGTFLSLALDMGLAQTIADTLRDIDRAIEALPVSPLAPRYRQRLEDQKASLRNPTLRTTVALVTSMCVKEPSLTPRIERAFSQLIERRPDLSGFYRQLPTAPADVAPLRRSA